MGFIELKIDDKDFPILNNFKKKELEKYILKIFKSGYQIHFPSTNVIQQNIEFTELVERIENVKDELKLEINNTDISDKINSLESSLSKLIGLSSNSCKKGEFGEKVLEELFNTRYGDIQYVKMNHIAHSGDAWIYFPDNKKIIIESKNYTNTVNKDEINKLQSDMITNHIKWGLMISFNSNITGMKELDFHTFIHNNETYSVIMISNLSTDFHKLDLGLQIIRKLINNFDNIIEFPWVIKDITTSMNELNQIIQKNYSLRDAYYTMERDVQKNLSSFHIFLRDYQYELDTKINEIINKITTTMKNPEINIINDYQDIINKYTDKKVLPLITRLVDIAQNKKCKIQLIDNNDWIFKKEDITICNLKVQAKKIILNIIENDITINLHIGKDKENKGNIDMISNLII